MSKSADRFFLLYAIFIVAFLALPVLVVIPSAFSAGNALVFPPEGWSLKWFRNALETDQFVSAFMLSAGLAVVATTISLVLGTMAAIAFVRYEFMGRELVLNLFLTPLIFPTIALAVGLVMVFSPLGLLRTFPGLVIGHVLVTLPYVIRTVGATLLEVDKTYEEAASTLGANAWTTFWRVLLPLLRPGLIAGATFSLIMSFDEFTLSLFLVGPGLMTLPLEIYNYTEYSMDPTVAAISTLLILLSLVCVVIVEKTVGLGKQL